MNRKLMIGCLLLLMSVHAYGWGRWGHQHINKAAVMALPPEMGMFFYDHADFMVEEAVIPDIRKHLMNDNAETNRHYIDLEEYGYTTPTNMPASMADAIARFGKDSVQRAGILPWYIEDMMAKLTNAFRNKNKTEILLISADLGHYIADAHMPLHTTVNHDGYSKSQRGIHSFWEAQLPEMFGDGYNLYSAPPQYVTDVPGYIWGFIAQSHILADTLLLDDMALRAQYHDSDMYEKDANGVVRRNMYGQLYRSKEYATRYHKMLDGMVEAQLRNAISAVSTLWYTAWVNAGKPDLNTLEPANLVERNKKYYEEDLTAYKKGHVSGFVVSMEY